MSPASGQQQSLLQANLLMIKLETALGESAQE